MGHRVRRVVVVLGMLASLTPVARAPAEPLAAPLSHRGRWFVDEHGRAVVLHGVNMVAKKPPYDPGALGFGEDDAAFLAAEGFNTVRLGVIYAGVEPARGTYDEAYLDSIERTVD